MAIGGLCARHRPFMQPFTTVGRIAAPQGQEDIHPDANF